MTPCQLTYQHRPGRRPTSHSGSVLPTRATCSSSHRQQQQHHASSAASASASAPVGGAVRVQVQGYGGAHVQDSDREDEEGEEEEEEGEEEEDQSGRNANELSRHGRCRRGMQHAPRTHLTAPTLEQPHPSSLPSLRSVLPQLKCKTAVFPFSRRRRRRSVWNARRRVGSGRRGWKVCGADGRERGRGRRGTGAGSTRLRRVGRSWLSRRIRVRALMWVVLIVVYGWLLLFPTPLNPTTMGVYAWRVLTGQVKNKYLAQRKMYGVGAEGEESVDLVRGPGAGAGVEGGREGLGTVDGDGTAREAYGNGAGLIPTLPNTTYFPKQSGNSATERGSEPAAEPPAKPHPFPSSRPPRTNPHDDPAHSDNTTFDDRPQERLRNRNQRWIGIGPIDYESRLNLTAEHTPPPTAMRHPYPATLDSVQTLSIAYLITVHNTETIAGAIELIASLYNHHHLFFIHVDKKVSFSEYEDLVQRYDGMDNVFFAPRRWSAEWGSFEIVELELELLKMAVNENVELKSRNERWEEDVSEYGAEEGMVGDGDDAAAAAAVGRDGWETWTWDSSLPLSSRRAAPSQGREHGATGRRGYHEQSSSSQQRTLPTNHRGPLRRPWKFAIFLCGASYPIHSNLYIQYQLSLLPPSSNIVFHNHRQKLCTFSESVFGDLSEPCHKSWARCLDEDCTTMSMTPKNGVVYKGMQWVMLSSDFSEWLIQNEDTILTPWKEFFHNTLGPDEFFFPTLLMQSPFNQTGLLAERPNRYVAPNHVIGIMYTDWNTPCLSHLNLWSLYSPCYLGEHDAQSMIESEFLFARKFKPGDPVKERLAAFRQREEVRIRQEWGVSMS